MQIRSSSEGLHLVSVPAAILEEPSMQRLMQVRYEVHDVLECIQAVVVWRAGGKHCGLTLDRRDHARA